MRPHRLWLAAFVVLAVAAAQAHAVHLRGRIIRVGYPAGGADDESRGADHYRPGYWTPVLVELSNDDGDLFQGILQVRQPDRDGDTIVASLPISVRETRTFHLYVPAAIPAARAEFRVRVTGEAGGFVQIHDNANQPVRELTPPAEPRPIPSAARTILDISQRPLTRLRPLTVDNMLVHELVVLRAAPSDLPDSSAGLQLADTIVWDDADPSQLRDVAQVHSLLEWTRQGGTLILAVSRNWQEVSRSPLGPVLPAALTGTESSTEVEGLSMALLGLDMPLDTPLVYCPVLRRNLAAAATAIVPAEGTPDSKVFVARRPCGRGQIVLVTAVLQELLARGTGARTQVFLRDLLEVRRRTREVRHDQGYEVDLFSRYIERPTGFQMTTTLFFLIAFLFVVVYIVVATGGSWAWLKARRGLHYSWLVFAAVAVAASGVSLLAVQFFRGIGHRVQQITVVDGRAGRQEVAAISYFGLKTAAHSILDLSVPRDWRKPDESLETPGGLQPLAEDPDKLDSQLYSAAQEYQAFAPLGQLRRVPLRATLKQFRGFWEGQLQGRLEASLHHRDTSSFRLDTRSWIENRLGRDLHDCHLFVAGRNLNGDHSDGGRIPHRWLSIEVYPLGSLADGRRVTLAERISEILRKEKVSEPDPTAWRPPTLQQLMEARSDSWFRKLGFSATHMGFNFRNEEDSVVSADGWVTAMLVMSVCDEIDQTTIKEKYQNINSSRARELDCSTALTREVALLVGFCDGDPGPARLCWRSHSEQSGGWRAIEPSEARTVYRFAIPVSPPGW